MRALLTALFLLSTVPAVAAEPVGSEPIAAKSKKKGKKAKAADAAAAEPAPAEAAPAEEPPPEAPPFVFGWPIDARAVVTETVLKKGERMTQRYTITSSARDDGNRIVAYSDFQFIAVDGRTLGAEERKALASAEAISGAIPSFVVDKEGTMLGVEGLEPMLEQVLGFLQKTEGMSDAELQQMKAVFASPQMQQMLLASSQRTWNTWAGDWVGLALPEGYVMEAEIPNAAGTMSPIEFRHLGTPAEHPGTVRIQYDMAIDPATMQQAMAGLLQAFAAADPELSEAELQAFASQMSVAGGYQVEATFDPKTLLPVAASNIKKLLFTMPGEPEPIEQLETHDYTFEWQR